MATLVATPATQKIARQIIRDTAEEGADAVLRWLPEVQPEQVTALLVLIAREAAAVRLPSGPRPLGRFVPDLLTHEERRRAHAAYERGERAEWVVTGEREYQRNRMRNRRDRRATTTGLEVRNAV
ncbi:MAG: hypothetical protein ACXVXP_00225 [Mycobacteriaceae bacterium]